MGKGETHDDNHDSPLPSGVADGDGWPLAVVFVPSSVQLPPVVGQDEGSSGTQQKAQGVE